jgi:hypothetical protein
MASWVRGVHQLTVQNREMLLPHEYSLLLIICGAVLLLFLINSSSRWSHRAKDAGAWAWSCRAYIRGTCQRYSTRLLTGNCLQATTKLVASIREIELLTFYSYNRRAKQPALPNRPRIAELAYVRYLQFAKARFQREHRQTTWCELGYGAWATRAKRAKKSGRCTHGHRRTHLKQSKWPVYSQQIIISERAGGT